MPPVYKTICEDDTAMFYGKVLKAAGTYQEIKKTKEGCDSILTLVLSVTPTEHRETFIRVYEKYLPYKWVDTTGGITYTRDCWRTDTIVKSWWTEKCLNTSTLYFTVARPIEEERALCGTQSTDWRKFTNLTEEGYYYDTVFYNNTDSIVDVYVLHLVSGVTPSITPQTS